MLRSYLFEQVPSAAFILDSLKPPFLSHFPSISSMWHHKLARLTRHLVDLGPPNEFTIGLRDAAVSANSCGL